MYNIFPAMDPNAPLNDLLPDSLDTVELVMALEEAFDLEIPDDDAEKFRTLDDVADYIEEKAKWREPKKSLLRKILKIIQEILGRVTK